MIDREKRMRLAAWRAAVRTVRGLRRDRQGRALVKAAGVTSLPADFDGIALLDDLDAVGSAYWLAGEGSSFGVVKADIDAFDAAVSTIRRAHAALSVAMRARHNARHALRASMGRDGAPRLDALRRELDALIQGASEGRAWIEANIPLSVELAAEAWKRPGTPYGHLVKNDLPAVFGRHLHRSVSIWERDGTSSAGAALVVGALRYLGFRKTSVAGAVKAAQRQRAAEEAGEQQAIMEAETAAHGHTTEKFRPKSV